MSNSCCIPRCKTDNKFQPKPCGVTLHTFPKDEAIKNAWTYVISKQVAGKYAPSIYARVCSLHFDDDSFVTESSDELRRYLKENAVPSIFPPKLSNKNESLGRKTTKTSAESRRELAKRRAQEELLTRIDENSIYSYDELITKLDSVTLPSNVTLKKLEDRVLFYSRTFGNGPVQASFTVVVKLDLSFELYSKHILMSNKTVYHLNASNRLKSISSLVKIISYMNCVKSPLTEDIVNDTTKTLKNILDQNNTKFLDQLSFIIEQLELLEVRPSSRRFSPELQATSLIWNNVSPSLYQQLVEEKILALPTQRHLQKLKTAFCKSTEFSSSNKKYIKERLNELSIAQQKIVFVSVNEILEAGKKKLIKDESTEKEFIFG